MQELILRDRSLLEAPVSLLGGKATNLRWMLKQGITVPPFFVVSSSSLTTILAQHGRQDAFDALLAADHPDMETRAQHLRTFLLDLELPSDFTQAIEEGLSELSKQVRQVGSEPDARRSFSVRSSAVGEDGSEASYAGQLESFLYRHSTAQVIEAIRLCWLSGLSDRILSYRQHHGLGKEPLQVAVVVQTMIDGDCSGVMFSANPLNGRRDESLITATYGACEGVVSGFCNTDQFSVRYRDHSIQQQVAVKDQKLVFDQEAGQGTKAVMVAPDLQKVASLTEQQILALHHQADQISMAAGIPQDIEFTIQADTIYILQTRPITAMPARTEGDGDRIVWDNSNIQESYCGLTLPLTFSFALKAYRDVYHTTCQVLRVNPRRLASMESVVSRMLGTIRGRVYYNINHWYALVGIIPGFSKNKNDMEKMMGLEDPVEFIQDYDRSVWQKLWALPQLFKTLFFLLLGFSRIDRLVAEFESMFHRHYQSIDRKTLQRMELHQLQAKIDQIYKVVTQGWATPIINDFFVMMMNGKVRRFLASVGLEDLDLQLNALLSGEEGIKSTEPTKRLLKLAHEVEKQPALAAIFDRVDDESLAFVLGQQAPEFWTDCQGFIEEFGDRTMGELKLETVTMRQNPAFMFAMIRNYRRNPQLNEQTLLDREKANRQAAEKVVFDAIRVKKGLRAVRRFKRLLGKLRKAIKHRENMRLARTRAFGLVRSMYLEIGHQLALLGKLDSARDVFYLRTEEIRDFMDGSAVDAKLELLVAARKAQYEAYADEEIPHHFSTYGAVNMHEQFVYDGKRSVMQDVIGDSDQLRGIGCQSGIVEAPVRLIHTPEDNLDLSGSILCAVRTDPGWTPLFPAAAGVLVERGSALSHSAVVAREMGIPAIVNIPGLTKFLRDGDVVRMDGSRGTIEVLSRAAVENVQSKELS